jgi:hypothetical protein
VHLRSLPVMGASNFVKRLPQPVLLANTAKARCRIRGQIAPNEANSWPSYRSRMVSRMSAPGYADRDRGACILAAPAGRSELSGFSPWLQGRLLRTTTLAASCMKRSVMCYRANSGALRTAAYCRFRVRLDFKHLNSSLRSGILAAGKGW